MGILCILVMSLAKTIGCYLTAKSMDKERFQILCKLVVIIFSRCEGHLFEYNGLYLAEINDFNGIKGVALILLVRIDGLNVVPGTLRHVIINVLKFLFIIELKLKYDVLRLLKKI